MTIFDYNCQNSFSVLLCYLNLSIPLRIKEQWPQFAQENNKLEDSGSCSKMTSLGNFPIVNYRIPLGSWLGTPQRIDSK